MLFILARESATVLACCRVPHHYELLSESSAGVVVSDDNMLVPREDSVLLRAHLVTLLSDLAFMGSTAVLILQFFSFS